MTTIVSKRPSLWPSKTLSHPQIPHNSWHSKIGNIKNIKWPNIMILNSILNSCNVSKEPHAHSANITCLFCKGSEPRPRHVQILWRTNTLENPWHACFQVALSHSVMLRNVLTKSRFNIMVMGYVDLQSSFTDFEPLYIWSISNSSDFSNQFGFTNRRMLQVLWFDGTSFEGLHRFLRTGLYWYTNLYTGF